MFFRKYLVLVLLFLWLINCSSFGYISGSFHHPLCYWFWWKFWVLLSFRMSAKRACWCTHHMQFNYYLLRKGYPESQPFHHFCSLKCLRMLQTQQHVASTVILPMALSFFFFFLTQSCRAALMWSQHWAGFSTTSMNKILPPSHLKASYKPMFTAPNKQKALEHISIFISWKEKKIRNRPEVN